MRGFQLPPSPPAVKNDPKAVASLVFGMLSMTCAGLFTGIPAMLLGSLAHKDIAESRGRTIGRGMATAGSVLGAFGTFVNVVFFAVVVALALGARGGGSGLSPVSLAKAHETAAPPKADYGILDVMALGGDDARPLRSQLLDAQKRAESKKKTLLVVTHASWSPQARRFEENLADPRMQVALSKALIAFVDIDEFGPELGTFGVEMDSVPFFFKIDSRQRAVDAITSAEWDDETPGDMAPVLSQFMAGTYTKRREPPAVGTVL
jgi:hypothetical protein